MNLKESHFHIASTNPNRPLLCPSPIKISETLELRRAAINDKDQVVALNAQVHGNSVTFGRMTENYFTTLNESPNPAFDYNCMTVVVDTSKGRIVSSCCSVPQIMIYGEENKREKISGSGTDFPVGDCCPRVPLIVTRPEAIGTLEEYRGQGLVNAHLDAHNKWATELGAVMQIISGIPGYYHRFGYENSLPTEITHVGYMHNVDSIAVDKQFNFRLATTADVDFIDRLARVAAIKRLSLWTDRDRIGWKNIIGGRIQGSCGARPVFLIERDSTKIGFVVMSATDDSCVLQFELDEPRNTNYASWTDVTLALIKWLPTFHLEHFLPILKEQSPQKYERDRKDRASTLVSNGWSFKFELGYSHPCLSAVGQSMLPKKPYQNKTWKAFWYTRIEDRTAFLRAIKPVLNYRLQSSTFEAITRKLYITSGFHSKKNVLIDIVNGKIKDISTVTDIQNPISIQNELFTQIVLGTKSFSETVQDRGDVFSLSEINAEIIDVLFPKMANDQVHGMD